MLILPKYAQIKEEKVMGGVSLYGIKERGGKSHPFLSGEPCPFFGSLELWGSRVNSVSGFGGHADCSKSAEVRS